MIHHIRRCRSRVALLLFLFLAGCGGGGPLKIKTNPALPGPWCAPNLRVQIGDRVVGHVGMGENKWKSFLVDDAGKEHDPEKLADQVWSYLEKTGDADKIKEAYTKQGRYPRMVVVSIKPTVVLLETHQFTASQNPAGSPQRYYWTAQIYAIAHPTFTEGMEWFSPDMKQRPTPLSFSKDGVAEIPLAKGKIRVTHESDKCATTRE